MDCVDLVRGYGWNEWKGTDLSLVTEWAELEHKEWGWGKGKYF